MSESKWIALTNRVSCGPAGSRGYRISPPVARGSPTSLQTVLCMLDLSINVHLPRQYRHRGGQLEAHGLFSTCWTGGDFSGTSRGAVWRIDRAQSTSLAAHRMVYRETNGPPNRQEKGTSLPGHNRVIKGILG